MHGKCCNMALKFGTVCYQPKFDISLIQVFGTEFGLVENVDAVAGWLYQDVNDSQINHCDQ